MGCQINGTSLGGYLVFGGFEWLERKLMRGGDFFIGQLSVPDIDASQERRTTIESILKAEIRHGFQIWESSIR